MNRFARAAIVGAATGLGFVLNAQAVSISGYDITQARLSGFGGWNHFYSGTIGSGDPTTYTGGRGTLNDGDIPTGLARNQLFLVSDMPTITLHLSSGTAIKSIELYGGNVPNNFVPGALTGWDVPIGGTTVTLASTDFGPTICRFGTLACNDSVSLLGTALEGVATSTVMLSNFQVGDPAGGWEDYFNIGEVTVSPVPEPETYALMLAGLGVLGFAARRRRT